MPKRTSFRLQDPDSHQWAIWNHQTYLLAHEARDICMGCFFQGDTEQIAEQHRERISAIVGRPLRVIPVSVSEIRWTERYENPPRLGD